MKYILRSLVRMERHGTLAKSLAICLVFSIVLQAGSAAQSPAGHLNWPGPGQLYVGTCYQPIERTPDEIDRDIALMKQARPLTRKLKNANFMRTRSLISMALSRNISQRLGRGHWIG